MSVNNLNISALSLGSTNAAILDPSNVHTKWVKLNAGSTKFFTMPDLIKMSNEAILILEVGPGAKDVPMGKYALAVFAPIKCFGPGQQDYVQKHWIDFGATVQWIGNAVTIVAKGDKEVKVFWVIGGPHKSAAVPDASATPALAASQENPPVITIDDDTEQANSDGEDQSANIESSYALSEVESSFSSAYDIGLTQETNF